MSKDKWIESVMQSADHNDRANAPDTTEDIVEMATKNMSLVRRIAASIALLIALNISTIYVYSSYQRSRSFDETALLGSGAESSVKADVGSIFFGNQK